MAARNSKKWVTCPNPRCGKEHKPRRNGAYKDRPQKFFRCTNCGHVWDNPEYKEPKQQAQRAAQTQPKKPPDQAANANKTQGGQKHTVTVNRQTQKPPEGKTTKPQEQAKKEESQAPEGGQAKQEEKKSFWEWLFG